MLHLSTWLQLRLRELSSLPEEVMVQLLSHYDDHDDPVASDVHESQHERGDIAEHKGADSGIGNSTGTSHTYRGPSAYANPDTPHSTLHEGGTGQHEHKSAGRADEHKSGGKNKHEVMHHDSSI